MKHPRQVTIAYIQRTGRPILKISFPFDYTDLDLVRTLPDRQYNNSKKFWTAFPSMEAIEKLKEAGFYITPELKALVKKWKATMDAAKEIEVPGLKGQLYPFQSRGVHFIDIKDGKVLVGDDMGLGKTIQALAWLQLHPEKRPVVVVVPAAVKINWAREAHAWMVRPRIQILSGTIPKEITGETIIINYDILPHWIPTLMEIKPQVLILDEAHYIKSSKTKRTKAVKRLARVIPHIIPLSGTQLVNRPAELYNALKLVDFNVVPSFWEFKHRYCDPKHNGFGWDFSGASNMAELHEKLKNVMIRRKKSEVLTDLPDKIHSFVPIELDNQAEYDKAEQNFIKYIKDTKGKKAAKKARNAQTLVQIEVLKQVAVRGKMKRVIDWIRDFLQTDEKLVVFAVHKFVIAALMEAFKDVAVKLDGSVTGNARQQVVDDFQTVDKIRLFIGNIKAAGVGITLTAASNVAQLELPWTPAELTQSSDRVHRIGQKYSVTIYYLLANNTIEEEIAQLLDKKQKIRDAILDGVETEQTSLLSELMNKYE